MAARAPLPERECAAVDCDRLFPLTRKDRQYCTPACRLRMTRWRKYGEAQRRPLYYDATRLAPDALAELREDAVHELVHGALSGAAAPTMAKVAGLIVAADKRLASRPSAPAI